MQPMTNSTYQGLLQRLDQLTGTPYAAAPVPMAMPAPMAVPVQVPYLMPDQVPYLMPDQVMLSPSAQAMVVMPPYGQAMVVAPPPAVIPSSPVIAYAPVAPVLPAATVPVAPTSNPLGLSWVETPLVVAPKGPAPSNPLGVSWLEMSVPAPQPAPQPATNPAPQPVAKPPEAKPAPKPAPKPKPAEAPKTKPAPKPAEKAKPVAKPAPKPAGTYTVRSGDTLSGIAQATLGNSGRWREIYDLNKGAIGGNPNVIVAGMVLKLPGGAAVSKPSSPTSKAGRVPYINQYSPAGNNGSYWNGPANCGPTSMAMIARAFGYGKSMGDAALINHLGRMGGTGGNGTNVSGIAAMARGIGKSAVTKGPGAHIDWIASELRAGKLVVANGDYHAMYPHINNSRTGGHYVAVIGLDNQGRFLVHDPAWKNGGAPIALTGAQLATFIRANPNGGWQISVG